MLRIEAIPSSAFSFRYWILGSFWASVINTGLPSNTSGTLLSALSGPLFTYFLLNKWDATSSKSFVLSFRSRRLAAFNFIAGTILLTIRLRTSLESSTDRIARETSWKTLKYAISFLVMFPLRMKFQQFQLYGNSTPSVKKICPEAGGELWNW